MRSLLYFSGHPIPVENQRHRSSTIASRRRRSFPAANAIETFLDDFGPPAHVTVGCLDGLVAARADDLHALIRRRSEKRFLGGQLALLIRPIPRKRVTGLVEEDHAAWRPE